MKKHIDKNIFLFLLLYLCVFGACKENKPILILDLFSNYQSLSQKVVCNISEDSLAQIEGLICDGENLIVNDYHSGNSYTLFDEISGKYIARFGTIGQGPDEIPLGCYGYLSQKYFSVFNDQTRIVMRYSLDSLRKSKVGGSPVCLTKYNIPDTRISRLIVIDDSTFLCGGVHNLRYQHLLFDKNDKIMDCSINLYNAEDSTFNKYTKYLANQGDLVMHPKENIFAYSVNFSSNIDFFKIVDNKIELVKSLRLGDPINKPVVEGDGRYQRVDLTEDSQIGYINLSATTKHVYALYSDRKLFENGRKSNIVLAFDWDGNPVKKYLLDVEAYYIAVDEVRHYIFAATKNSEGGWRIVCYIM